MNSPLLPKHYTMVRCTQVVGRTFCHFRILERIGAGGMGEVYRAADTRLNRDVAVKVLSDALSRSADHMARFEREAQVLASLKHPNIAAIYGVEEADGIRALIMELVEGPTLAEMLAHGPIPLNEALPVARQIAEGLEYAHERGIVHRDLKPANVKLTRERQVKILDFGLAKVVQELAAGVADETATIRDSLTREGMIVGTAPYMSPEQARGKPMDRRSDIWSFGAVLFEMLGGSRAFPGDDFSQVLAAVIMNEPDWIALPPELPPSLTELLRRCLTKDPRRRLQAIGDARIVLDNLSARLESGEQESARIAGAQTWPARRRALPWAVACIAALALAVTLLWVAPRLTARYSPAMRLVAEVGADVSLDTSVGVAAALSPDGITLAFTARPRKGGPTELFIRRLDRTTATPLAGTEQASNPFFSPNGQWIAFFAGGKLRKVAVSGGGIQTLCDASDPRGGDWGDDGNIVFAPGMNTGLFRISQAGGTAEQVTTLSSGEKTHRWPQVLPGGRAVLFTAHDFASVFDNANIMAQPVGRGGRKLVQRGGTYARYLPGGYLVYLHDRTLFAAPFDLKRLDITGAPVSVVNDMSATASLGGAAQFAYSSGGMLVYVPDQGSNLESVLVWMERDGKVAMLRNPAARHRSIRLSPDGRRIAINVLDEKGANVWIYDWRRDQLSRLTSDSGVNGWPVWTPDGLRVAFSSERSGRGINNLYWQRADGTGEPQRLTVSDQRQRARSWHPGGKFLAFDEDDPQTQWDIRILPLEGSENAGWKPGKPFVFLNGPGNESMAAFSPDGRWLAYTSDESGRAEVYVRPFPVSSGKWQISTKGGIYPVWSRARRELFYSQEDGVIMVAGYTASAGKFETETPRAWSPVPVLAMSTFGGNFDVTPDGNRLLALRSPDPGAERKRDKLTFISNFTEELSRLTKQ